MTLAADNATEEPKHFIMSYYYMDRQQKCRNGCHEKRSLKEHFEEVTFFLVDQ